MTPTPEEVLEKFRRAAAGGVVEGPDGTTFMAISDEARLLFTEGGAALAASQKHSEEYTRLWHRDAERARELAEACVEGLEHDGMVRWSCRLCGDWVLATLEDDGPGLSACGRGQAEVSRRQPRPGVSGMTTTRLDRARCSMRWPGGDCPPCGLGRGIGACLSVRRPGRV